MAVYNDSFMNNVTNFADIFTGISSQIGNEYLIGNMIIISFFFVFMAFGFGKEDFLNVLVSDSLITSIIAMLLFSINMIASYMVILPIIIFILALIFKLASD